MARALTLWLAFVLSGCWVDSPVDEARQAADGAVAPVVVAVREVVEPIAPEPPAAVIEPTCPRAVALIVEFEVIGQVYYERNLRWPIWPGAASGVTWGIGYDGGHQTRQRILADWWMHEHREPLSETSGITGSTARDVARGLRYALTDWPMAVQVFEVSTLPAYEAMTERAFSNGWEALPACAQGALVSLVYNRGTQMTGDRRLEMRMIRDQCVPSADAQCIAGQLRAMTRIWAGTDIEAGMRRRRNAEADLALM